MKSSIGRIVHYVNVDIDDPVAAIITKVNESSVCLTVFHPNASPVAVDYVPHESLGAKQRCFWRWPERES